MDQEVQVDIKDVRLTLEKHFKDSGIEGPVRIVSAKFYQGYWDVVVYSRDIEISDKKQKIDIIAILAINDSTKKVESFSETPTQAAFSYGTDYRPDSSERHKQDYQSLRFDRFWN